MLIDGDLVPSVGGALFDVEYAATAEVAGQVTDGTESDMARGRRQIEEPIAEVKH